MDAYTLKVAVKNAVKEALAENDKNSSPQAQIWYDKTMRKINQLPEGEHKKGLLFWMKDFLAAAPSVQGPLAKGVEDVLKKMGKN